MKSKYEIIIYWSEDDDAFIAEVPELSGCMADGASYIEAIENVKRSINRIKMYGLYLIFIFFTPSQKRDLRVPTFSNYNYS